ncbi:MAG: hypothetical protein IKG01_13580 [Lachnospiraceae bacterium]|nr:hypothetical protein [Lachnospiraceae bacterium]
MKQTRREREACNEANRSGYLEGFAEGYKQGLHDGNPFIYFAESVARVAQSLNETINDPKFVELYEEAKRLEAEEYEDRADNTL